MKLLLDTHILVWAVDNPAKLSVAATAHLQDPANELLVSIASAWEIAIKVGVAKLSLSLDYRSWMDRAVADLGASLLPITVPVCDAQIALPLLHRDPFDRIIIAQALTEGVPVLTSDMMFGQYSVTTIW